MKKVISIFVSIATILLSCKMETFILIAHATQLSPHFASHEFVCDCGCGQEGNISPELIDRLEELFSMFNCSKIIVSSGGGYRCYTTDRHHEGLAADVTLYDNNGAVINSKIVCCVAADIGINGVANINTNYRAVHIDVRTGNRYWGDEIYGYSSIWNQRGGDGNYHDNFYEYFGLTEEEVYSHVTTYHQITEKPTGHEISESEAAGRTIPDGDYCIQSTVSGNFYVDPDGIDFPAPNETNVSLYDFGGELPPAHDTWTFTYLNNGFYKITQKGTDQCMDVAGVDMHSEANVHLWTYGGGANQMWSVRPVGNGYSIQAKHSGFYLDAAGGKPEKCNIWVYESNGTAAQIFNLISVKTEPESEYPEKPIVHVEAGYSDKETVITWQECQNIADPYYCHIYNCSTGEECYWLNEGNTYPTTEGTRVKANLAAGEYYVEVTACNHFYRTTTSSDRVYFTVSDPPAIYPDKPTLKVNATDEAHPVAFSWAACDNADWYDVRIYKSDDTNIVSQMEIKDLSFTYSLEVGNYYANVASVNANGNYQFSDNISFTVSEAPTTLRFVAGREFMREVPVTVTLEYPRGYIGSLFISYPSEYMQPVFNGDSDVLVNSENGVIEIMIDGVPESTYTKEFKMQLVEDIPTGEYKLTGELQDYHDPDDTERTLDYTATEGIIRIYRPEKLDDIYGDTNYDGKGSISDVSMILKFTKEEPTDAYLFVAADTDADGIITDADTKIPYEAYFRNNEDLPTPSSKWLELYSKLDTEKLLKHELAIIDSGQCGKTEEDKVFWRLFSDGTLIISGKGAMPNGASYDDMQSGWLSYDDVPWYKHKENINKAVIADGVMNIGVYSFYCYTSLTSVTIPDSVTSIEEEAFSFCEALKEITIPNSVTIIGDYAFDNCKSLTSVKIPYNVEKIGSGAFSNCNSLTDIIVDSENTSYIDDDGVLFNRNRTTLLCYPIGKTKTAYIIPDSVTTIANSAFRNSVLTSITIPNSVMNIKAHAFRDCNNLRSIALPDSVESIGYAAFDDCKSLTEITLPNSISNIGDYAFSSCTSLTEITIPNSVTSIGSYAFQGCKGLETVTLPESIVSIAEATFIGCTGLTSITIPDGVESIGNSAFKSCKALKEITILNPECKLTDNGNSISDTAVIRGYLGSTAQMYAEKYDRTFIPLDANYTETTKPTTTTNATTNTTKTTATTTKTTTTTTKTTATTTKTTTTTTKTTATTTKTTATTTKTTATTTKTTATTTKTTATTTKTTATTTKITTTTTNATSTSTTLPPLELDKESITLTNGDQYTIFANRNDVTYRSNNPDVAVVSKTGIITAVGIGQAKITIIDSDFNVVQITVEVTAVTTAKTTTDKVTTTTETVTTTTSTKEPLLGDVNRDGEVSIADAVLLCRITAEDSCDDVTLTEQSFIAADYDKDNLITILDVMKLLKYLHAHPAT